MKPLFFIILFIIHFNVSGQSKEFMKIDSLYHLLQKGESFDSLAAQHSEDIFSSINNGKLPYYKLDIFEETFRYYLKDLKINEISKPFESIFGWYIIKLLDINENEKYLVQTILIKDK